MTANQFFRGLTFFLGVFIFPALLAIGIWSVKQYGMVLDMSATSLTGLERGGQSSSAAYQETPAGAMSMTGVLASLYSFSLMMTFTLLRHKPNYLAMLGATTALVVSLAIASSSVDWIVVAALTPAWLFLLAWVVAVGPAWEGG
jgi:hypothetical protein